MLIFYFCHVVTSSPKGHTAEMHCPCIPSRWIISDSLNPVDCGPYSSSVRVKARILGRLLCLPPGTETHDLLRKEDPSPGIHLSSPRDGVTQTKWVNKFPFSLGRGNGYFSVIHSGTYRCITDNHCSSSSLLIFSPVRVLPHNLVHIFCCL